MPTLRFVIRKQSYIIFVMITWIVFEFLVACQFRANENISSRLEDGQIDNPVPVKSLLTFTTVHTATEGIERVEFMVEGHSELTTVYKPKFPQNYFQVEHEWRVPSEAKDSRLLVTTYDKTGQSTTLTIEVQTTEDILPVVTQEPEPTSALPTPEFDVATACANIPELVTETIPDNTVLEPGVQFVKSWRIKNVGTCPWNTAYYFDSVDDLSLGATQINLPHAVSLGGVVDLSLTMVAPIVGGTYQSKWQLFDALGRPFGNQFFVLFKVPGCDNRGPVIQTFQASPTLISLGQNSILNWQVSGATEVTLNSGSQVNATGNIAVGPNTTTRYTLTATDGTCTQTAQAVVTVSTSDTSCQGLAITLFEARPNTIDLGQSSDLRWTVSGATSLRLDSSTEASAEVNTTASTRRVSPKETTHYTLEAKNDSCTLSARTTVTVNPASKVPSAPSHLRVAETAQTELTLTWQDNSTNETQFELFNVDTGLFIATYAPNLSTGSVTGLACGTRYQFQLFAANSLGSSTASNTLSVPTKPCGQ